MDYYGVKKNALGYDNILGIIDLATGHLVLRAVKRRTSANTAHVLLYDIVCRKGVPMVLHSDAAQEFLGGATASLATILGCKQSTTKAHNPKGNAKIERIWAFVRVCLAQMTDEQYANFHMYAPIMAHVWNTTVDSDTGYSPFEVEHGIHARHADAP